MWWIGIIIAIGVFFLFVRFTTVEEGTAKAVMTLGKFDKILFQWKGHWMDTDENIWKEKERKEKEEKEGAKEKKTGLRIFGGLYLYGIRPIHKIYRYPHRWTDLHLTEEGKMELKLHEEEKFDHVLLKPAVYAIKLFAVETAPPERIPVDVTVLITLKITNPYLFLFVAPPTPLEDVLARITALMREAITACTTDELLKIKAEDLWAEEKQEQKGETIPALLNKAKLIKDTLGKWGMELADRGIEIREIGFPAEYQKAAAARRVKEMEAEARAAETIGTVIASMARIYGKEVKEMPQVIEQDPVLRKEFLEKSTDLIVRRLGMESNSYVDIRVQGAKGIERIILNSLAAWKRMPMGTGAEIKEEKRGGKPAESEKELLEKEIRKSEEKMLKTEDLDEWEKLVIETSEKAERLRK